MAEDNYALVVDPPDDALSIGDYDIETGLRSSTRRLIHNFEEEPQRSTAAASIKKSIRSSIRKTKYYCDPLVKAIKYVLNKSKLLIVITIYSVFGAWLFTTLEVPHDLAMKEEQYHARLIAREVMILNLRAIFYSQKEDREERWKDAIKQFEKDLSLDEPSLDTDWTFWMAFLYAGTIYTTIGYGNIACKTKAGQIATLLYAFIGIPIMIIILNDLGDFLLHILEWLANTTSDGLLFLGVRWGMLTLEENSKRRKRFLAFRAKLVKKGIISSSSSFSIETRSITDFQAGNKQNDEVKPDPPVFSAVFATFGWIFLAARVFCIWEEWSYFTSIYFIFISCSTIGLGDVVPAHPEYMILAFGVVMVGLSLVTVCINVVQAKIELMYMELLQKILKDYIAAMENGDANAAQDMMAGFSGAAKFLLPFISKNQGAKVMTQFREDCVAQGIEPPAVLVDINPNTGKPAFASAPKEDYKDYIEHADERRQEERKVEESRLLSRVPQSEEPRRHITTQSLGIQAMMDSSPLQEVKKVSLDFGLQVTPEYSDEECQTSDCESVDEGIQTWPSMESISVQYDAIETIDSVAQYDIIEEKPILCDTAVQPDVSSIYLFDEDYGSDESSDDSHTDFEDTDIEPHSDHLTVAVPTFHSLRKSISIDSQETVIHVSPTGSPTTSRKKALQKRLLLRNERRKKRELRLEHSKQNLRYMRCSAVQTEIQTEDSNVQVEYSTQSTESQYDLITSCEVFTQHFTETRGRRCQTKLTCLSASNRTSESHPRRVSARRRQGIRNSQQRSITSSTDAVESVSSMEDRLFRSVSTDISNRNSSESQSPLYQAIPEEHAYQHSSQQMSPDDYMNWENSQQAVVPYSPGIHLTQAAAGNIQSPTTMNTETGEVAEISLNISLVSRAVDENGRYIDDFDLEYDDDDVFESDDDIAHEDLEEFTVSMSTQTELTHEEIYNSELEVLRKSLEIEIREQIEEQLAEEALNSQADRIECSIQTNSSSFYAIQYAGLPTILERSIEDNSSLCSTPDPTNYHFLADSICQTNAIDISTNTCQTESVFILDSCPTFGDRDIQTSFDAVDAEIQTNRDETIDDETQTLREEADNETQTIDTTMSECYCQTDEDLNVVETFNVDVQTFISSSDIPTQTIITSLNEQMDNGTQANMLDFSSNAQIQTLLTYSGISTDIEIQTVISTVLDNSKNIETQTSTPGIKATSSQTPRITPLDRQIQTEHPRRDQKRCQTDVFPPIVDCRSFAVDATPSVQDSESQPEVSMLTISEEDIPCSQLPPDMRFNIERGTCMEEKRLKSVESQSPILETEVVGIQVMPSLTTSHTQYTYVSLSDDFTQTDIYMKSKSTQGILAVCEMSDHEAQTMIEQQDRYLDCDDLNHSVGNITSSTVNLWSDFDRIAEGLLCQTDKVNAESQTYLDKEQIEKLITLQVLASKEIEDRTVSDLTYAEKDDSACKSTPTALKERKKKPSSVTCDATLKEVDEAEGEKAKTLPLRKKKKKIVNVKKEEAEVQAVVDTRTLGVGQEGRDNWREVYLAELDQERRQRMLDIGIQTGVLARVQHMYGRRDHGSTESEVSTSDNPRVNLRKTESSEYLRSQESLARTNSVMSIAESFGGDESSPGPSKPTSRSSSFKRTKRTRDLHQDAREQTVADLRSRFEESDRRPRRNRSSSNER